MSLTFTDVPPRLRDRVLLSGGIPPSPLVPVEGECWLYDGWHNDAGYPYIHWDGRDQPVHRVLYVLLTGDDITGLDLDHLCRVVACIRPSHHEAVTHTENIRRLGLAQTSCRRAGHDWADPRNVRVRRNGRRWCAECDRQDQRARYAARTRVRA